MKILKTKINDLKIIKSYSYRDKRGFLRETYKKDVVGTRNFPFDIITYSKKNVLRGLHFQTKKSQAKIITISYGKIFDVAVDLRKNSKTFGKSFKIILSDKNCLSLFIPKGFAHAYYSFEKTNIVYYKLTNYYKPNFESGINLLDESLKIKWPKKNCQISKKDKNLQLFKDFRKIHKFL